MLDQTALDNIRTLQRPGQPDLLTRIIDTYSRNADALVKGLHRALQDGDIDETRRHAHTFKSAAANLGASASVGVVPAAGRTGPRRRPGTGNKPVRGNPCRARAGVDRVGG